MAARDAAMKSWSKTAAETDSDDEVARCGGRGRKRRRGIGALEFQETKREDVAELRKEEMSIRREEIALQSIAKSSLRNKCSNSNSTRSSNLHCNSNRHSRCNSS